MKQAIKKYLIESGFKHRESDTFDVLYKDILKDVEVLVNLNDKEMNCYINVNDIDEEDGFPKYAVLKEFKKDIPQFEDKEEAAHSIVAVMLQKVLSEYISR